jgi:hypothetical protein
MRSIAELEKSPEVTPDSLLSVLGNHALRGHPVCSTTVIRIIDRTKLSRSELIKLKHITEKGTRVQRNKPDIIGVMEYERIHDHVSSLQQAS